MSGEKTIDVKLKRAQSAAAALFGHCDGVTLDTDGGGVGASIVVPGRSFGGTYGGGTHYMRGAGRTADDAVEDLLRSLSEQCVSAISELESRLARLRAAGTEVA